MHLLASIKRFAEVSMASATQTNVKDIRRAGIGAIPPCQQEEAANCFAMQ